MSRQSPRTVIIGGGVVGLCSAYFLAKSGHQVAVIDRDPSGRESCANRNAGMIVPSHFTPLAAPGVISQGLKWMLNRKSPFYLRPRFDLQLAKWCWQFFRHSNRRHVENCSELLRDLSLESRYLFAELADELNFDLVERGLLMLCQSEAGLKEETEVAEAARRLGLQTEVCGPERIRELEPGTRIDAIGGVWFPQDAHLDPEKFLSALRRGIAELGGEFITDQIVDYRVTEQRVHSAVSLSGKTHCADFFILAGGAWCQQLAKSLGLELPIQGGKGYSFTLPNPGEFPVICSLLKEGRVAVTPMGRDLRVAGTMEICGDDLSIDQIRLEGIIESFCGFYPAYSKTDFEKLEPWAGLRPCSPDGLPYIGKVRGIGNGIVASGHAMLGLSLGPVTGRLVSDLVKDGESDRRLHPGRFG